MSRQTFRSTVTAAIVLTAALAACEDGGPTAFDPEPDFAAATVAEAAVEAAGITSLQAQDSLVSYVALSDTVRDGRPERQRDARPRLMLTMGNQAVELATRLIGDAPDPEQLRFLERAIEAQRAAQAAWEAGELGRAAALAEHALITSLKAVVVPGGVTEEEARTLSTLSADLLGQARAALGDDPTPHESKLLAIAHQLHERGVLLLEGGNVRGVVFLWRSAVISSLLLA